MNEISTYLLRLPRSVKATAEKPAREECISLNQFVGTAAAESSAAMSTAAFFSERRERADQAAFRKILRRSGGAPPREGDAA